MEKNKEFKEDFLVKNKYLGSVLEDLKVTLMAGVSPSVVTARSQALNLNRSDMRAHKLY